MKPLKLIGLGLITVIVLLFAFAPLFGFANTDVSSPNYDVNSPVKSFQCEMYTKNTIGHNGKLTDNKPHYANTTVVETAQGFTLKAGTVFKEAKVLSNETLGHDGNLASDHKTILMKRDEVPGSLYFMIYSFTTDQNPKARTQESPIDSLIVLAACTRKQ